MFEPNNYDHFRSTVAAAPVVPDGSVNVEQGVFVPNDPPGTYKVHNMAHYEDVLLSVHFSTAETHSVEGSAVMVAPGVAVAAAHVIEPHIQSIMKSELRIACNGLTSSGLRHWKVRHICKVDNSDLVVLSLEYATESVANNTFRQAQMENATFRKWL